MTDTAFAHAVRTAANGNDEPLDELLRSGAPIGSDERELLTDLELGSLRPVMGRGAALTRRQQRYHAARYIAGGSHKGIMADVTTDTGMDKGTVLGWVRTLRDGLDVAPDSDEALRQIIAQHEQDRPAPTE